MSAQDIRMIGVADIEGWARIATPGEALVYCTGPFVPPGAVKAIVRYLVEARAVRSHQRRTAGGTLEHVLVKRGQEEPPGGRWRRIDAAGDAATEAIHAALARCAARGRRAYSNFELARIAGLATRNQAAWRVRKLAEAGRISIETVDGPDRLPWRIVHIGARSTAAPGQAHSTGSGQGAQ
jgi:hypothetical protein